MALTPWCPGCACAAGSGGDAANVVADAVICHPPVCPGLLGLRHCGSPGVCRRAQIQVRALAACYTLGWGGATYSQRESCLSWCCNAMYAASTFTSAIDGHLRYTKALHDMHAAWKPRRPAQLLHYTRVPCCQLDRCSFSNLGDTANTTIVDGEARLYGVTYSVPGSEADSTCSGPKVSTSKWHMEWAKGSQRRVSFIALPVAFPS